MSNCGALPHIAVHYDLAGDEGPEKIIIVKSAVQIPVRLPQLVNGAPAPKASSSRLGVR